MEHPLGLKVPRELDVFFRAWVAKDAGAMAASFTAEGEYWVPGQEGPLKGREAIRAYFLDFFQRNQSLELHRSRFFTARGELVSVSELTMELPMLGPGRYLVTSAQTYAFAEDGLIRRARSFVDAEGAVRMAEN